MFREEKEGELFFTLACVDNDSSKVFDCIEEREADGRGQAERLFSRARQLRHPPLSYLSSL